MGIFSRKTTENSGVKDAQTQYATLWDTVMAEKVAIEALKATVQRLEDNYESLRNRLNRNRYDKDKEEEEAKNLNTPFPRNPFA